MLQISRLRDADAPRAATAVARLAPGVAWCLAVATLCTVLLRLPGVPAALASPMLLAIVLGAVVASVGGAVRRSGARGPAPATTAGRTAAGTRWAAVHLLRAGVVLLGLRLSVPDVLALGWHGVLVAGGALLVTFGATLAIGHRMRLPRGTVLLIATSFSVCGAAAASTMVSVLPRGEEETDQEVRERDTALATAIALVTVLGLACVLVGPWVARGLGMTDAQAGLWIGASFPEVAHVAAAAGTVSAAALGVATVAKLARVALLAPLTAVVSAALGERARRGTPRTSAPEGARDAVPRYGSAGKRAPLVPLFVLGFLACVVVRSTGLVPGAVLHAADGTATFLLVAAMFAMGLGVDLPRLVRTARRPLLLGLAATGIITVVAGALVMVLG